MTTVATGQFPPAGLTPAGPTTSVAAQLSPLHLPPTHQARLTLIKQCGERSSSQRSWHFIAASQPAAAGEDSYGSRTVTKLAWNRRAERSADPYKAAAGRAPLTLCATA